MILVPVGIIPAFAKIIPWSQRVAPLDPETLQNDLKPNIQLNRIGNQLITAPIRNPRTFHNKQTRSAKTG